MIAVMFGVYKYLVSWVLIMLTKPQILEWRDIDCLAHHQDWVLRYVVMPQAVLYHTASLRSTMMKHWIGTF